MSLPKTMLVNAYCFHLGPLVGIRELLVACRKLAKLVKKFIY